MNRKLNTKVGILGGGQLGKMIGIAASPWHLPISFMDPAPHPPVEGYVPNLIKGSLDDWNDILNFGLLNEVVSIEIEHIRIDALYELEKKGIEVYPQPKALEMIQDKGLQKEFYSLHGFPSSPFQLINNKNELLEKIKSGALNFPFVQKLRKGGYDGKGVLIVQSSADIENLFDAPSVIEQLISIKKEIAIIGARNKDGDFKAFPAVEMEFNQEANLVEFLSCPANITSTLSQQATSIVEALMKKSNIVGLLAVEFFLTHEDNLLINEIAPRPHNSGHHTIESCITSQFEQHLRSILNLPLGNTEILSPSIMLNLLGEEGYQGTPIYDGIEKVLELEGVHIHIYGKSLTHPYRKMGHVTITAPTLQQAREKAQKVKTLLKVVA
jgi:5-(carboxyamino)imidazole ribonucleotide synthase